MKKVLSVIFISMLFVSAMGQTMSRVTLGETGNFISISFDLDENVLLDITPDGSLGEWGIDLYRGRNQYNLNRLQPYNGRIEYYKENDNEAYRGKIKYIGKILITYYASFDDETLRGKIKSIGRVNFDYYPKYENAAFIGKLKSAGPSAITYYPAFGNDPNAGKLKGVGSAAINYYGQFDDKTYKGKIKSIGNVNYTWYGSSETNKDLRGRMKNGSQIQPVNGLKFYVKTT